MSRWQTVAGTVAALVALASPAAHGAEENRPDAERASVSEAEKTAADVRDLIVTQVAAGRRDRIALEIGGSATQGTVETATPQGLTVKTAAAAVSLPWAGLTPELLYSIGAQLAPRDDASLRLRLGRFCLAHGLVRQARIELAAAAKLDPGLAAEAAAGASRLDELERRSAQPVDRPVEPPKPKTERTPALPVAGKTARALTKLGRSNFLFGLFTGTGDTWIPETRKQGCLWDMRYLYLAGGINTPRPWREVNQPAGQYAFNYMLESEKQGLVPVFTWYQMRQSLPGHKEEAPAVKTNCETVDTMRQYFSDVKLFMELAARFGKPVVFHVEPDMTGFFLTFGQFQPNDPDRILVRVAASGLPEVARYPDTLKGFFQAIAGLRDKLAPNVLLAWHASLWGDPPPLKRIADLILASGDWDLIFVDPSDRDAGWKLAKNYALHDVWWDDVKFAKWRTWSAELHQMTDLPLLAWQIPIGNTIMAACNNTEGHYMDNRPQYWLEDYPKNTHLLEWAQAGYIGLLFGGGAGGCTSFADSQKDGVTNPPPVKGNKGETSQFPDDDGGYLRMRVARYYASPLRFAVRAQKK